MDPFVNRIDRSDDGRLGYADRSEHLGLQHLSEVRLGSSDRLEKALDRRAQEVIILDR